MECKGECERPRLRKELDRCRANKDQIVDVTEYTKCIAELEEINRGMNEELKCRAQLDVEKTKRIAELEGE